MFQSFCQSSVRRTISLGLKKIGADSVSEIISIRNIKNVKHLRGVKTVRRLPVFRCEYSKTNAAGTHLHPHLADITSHISPCGLRIELSDGQAFGPTPAVCDSAHNLIHEASCDWGKLPGELGIVKRLWFPSAVRLPGKTFLASCLGSETYFHWITDAMPMLLWERAENFLKDYDYFLVHPMFKKFHKESMKYLGIRENQIKFLNKNKRYCCENLTFHIRHHVSGRIPKNTIKKVKTFLNQQQRKLKKTTQRIAIVRHGKSSRKIQNDVEIAAVLKKNRFKLIQPDKYSLKKQADIFKNARIIVAAHGSALTNIIFCRRGTKILELFAPDYVNPCYRHIALQIGLKHFPLMDDRAGAKPITRLDKANSDIHISPEQLERLLKKIV